MNRIIVTGGAGTDYVGLNESCRIINRPVNMGFSGKVHDMGRFEIRENAQDGVFIANISQFKFETL